MLSCPPPSVLERAFAALLDDGPEEPDIVSHVEVCSACQSRLEALTASRNGTHRDDSDPAATVDSRPPALDQTTDDHPAPTSAPDGRGGHPADTAQLPEVPGYEILGRLGKGGMGVVYKARDEKLNRVVALKMVLAGEHADPDQLARFYLEAEAVAHLRHPNVVQIYEIGTAGGVPYIALEYLPGGRLDQGSRQGPQPPRRAAELVRTLAQAVHTAHQAGIVHRDLKPANVLFAQDGTAKVTDFGLAKRLEAPGQTQTGQILGTPAYMAPEQARGESKSVGPAADLYALGAILYELLTGRPPFQGDSVMQTLQQVLRDEPVPPRKLAPGVPADLETVCLKALHKEAGQRYPTAQEFADELNRFLHDEPVRARPLRRFEKAYRWCRRNPTLAGLLAAGAGLLLMAGVSGTLGFYHVRLRKAKAGEEEQRGRAEVALRQAQRYLYLDSIHLADRAYQDNQLARARELLRDCPDEQRGWEWHYLDRITHAERLDMAGHTQAVHALAFPRHGKWMVSGSGDRTLRFWEPRTGERLQQLTGHSGPVWGVAVSPDTRRLASVAGSARHPGELIVWDLAGGPSPQPRVAFRVRATAGERAAVAFHPTRPLLAVAAGIRAGRPAEVVVLDALGGVVRRWTGAGQGCVALAWSKDGRRLAASFVGWGASNTAGEVALYDPEARSPVSRFRPHDGQALALAYSQDGRALATAGADRLIRLWDAGDLTPRQTLRGHLAAVTALTFTAGGRLLSGSKDTTVRAWDPAGGRELFLRRGHEGPVECVAVDPMTGQVYSGSDDMYVKAWRPEKPQEGEAYALHRGAATAVAFSPDGAMLVSVGLDGAVWRIDPTGRARPRKLRQEQRPLWKVRFLPGSHTLLVAGGVEEPGRDDGTVRLVDARDGGVRGELNTGLTAAVSLSVSRDGGRLAVVGRTRERKTVVQVWDVASRRRRHQIEDPAANAIAAELYAGGNRLLVLLGNRDGDREVNYRLFELGEEARPVGVPRHQQRGGRFAVFAANESFMIGGGGDTGLSRYRMLPTGALVLAESFKGHATTVHNAALSPDEKQIATASEDETVRLWDLDAARELLVLYGDRNPMNDVAFSPNGELLAAAQASGSVRVWDGRPRPQAAHSLP
jgi:eukaryotic-like serine/threonine-protein kinase